MPGWLVRVQRARPGGISRWGFCSLETHGSLGKSSCLLPYPPMADLSLPSLLTRLLSYAAPIFNTSSLGRRTAYGEPHLCSEIDRMMALMGWRADADVAELVDALDLGSSAERRGGSSPFIRTTLRSSSFGWRATPKLVRRRNVLRSPTEEPFKRKFITRGRCSGSCGE